MSGNMPRSTIRLENIEISMMRYLRKVATDRDIEMFAEISTAIIQYIGTMIMATIPFLRVAFRMEC